MQSLQGQLLVASPYLADADFARTVILLLHHDQQRAIGIVLNRPAGRTVGEMSGGRGRLGMGREQPLNLGGPIAGPMMVIEHPPFSASGGEKPSSAAAGAPAGMEDSPPPAGAMRRVFFGHAHWDAPQLQREIDAGAWLVTRATVNLVFGETSELWQTAVRQVGRGLMRSVLSIEHMPEDPSLN